MVAKRWAALAMAGTLSITSAASQTPGPEPAGTFEVSTDPVTCGESTALRFWKLQFGPPGAISRVGKGPIAGIDCRWIIHGPVPGTYQVDLIQPEGSAGSSEPFVVRPNEITRVVIGRPSARISGRISANGAPLAAASLEIEPKDRRWGTTSVTTDANGRYSAFLARAGEYEMRLSGKSAPTTSKIVDVAAGSNTVDWALAERGSVSVRVRGIRAGLPTTVRIEARQAIHTGELKSGDEPVLTKVGLGFETYSVSATQGDALVSPITNVQLDAAHPEATVDVELAENRSSLVLSDPSGDAVRDARVRAVSPARSH